MKSRLGILHNLYAKPSNEVIPIHGLFVTSQKALIVERPILIPVKEPWTFITSK